jgi:hypothetical protein
MTLALALAVLLTQAPDTPAVSPQLEETPAPEEQPEDPRDAAIRRLEESLAEVRSEVEELKSRPDWVSKLSARFSGYFDLGFFWVQGDGSGVRKDFGHALYPHYRDQLLGSWVLLGDPLSTAINSRGDVADVGDGRALRDDPVHSNGKPTFMVNALSLALLAEIIDGLTLHARLDFLPRDRDFTDARTVGDLFDFKLAFLRYEIEAGPVWLTFSAGKFDSLLGFEYRTQEAPNRVGITPSLVCRYTCGRPVGLKIQAEFFDRHLEVAGALTNGSHQMSVFGFANETDFNRWKTVAGRVTVRLPVAPRIELNANAAIGPQDRQTDDNVLQWHYGFAAGADFDRVFVSAEFVKGHATGKPGVVGGVETPCAGAPCLDYRGLYVLGAVRVTGWLTPYARFDWRHAIHRDGDRFIYLSDVARATVGVNVHPWQWLAVKAEYVFNREVSGFEFPDDVFTTSLVVQY